MRETTAILLTALIFVLCGGIWQKLSPSEPAMLEESGFAPLTSPALDDSDAERMIAENEMEAVKTLHSAWEMATGHRAVFGNFPNTATFSEVTNAWTPVGNACNHSGYKFTYTRAGDAYSVTAVPLRYGSTGRRAYIVDEAGIVKEVR